VLILLQAAVAVHVGQGRFLFPLRYFPALFQSYQFTD
jgi:hypothetical protein